MTYFCTQTSRHASRSVEISSASFHRVPLFSMCCSPHVLSWADKNMAQKSSHAVWPTSGVIIRGCNRTSSGTLEYAKNAEFFFFFFLLIKQSNFFVSLISAPRRFERFYSCVSKRIAILDLSHSYDPFRIFRIT